MFAVFVGENFHYMAERWKLGDFETLDEALAQCRRLVDQDLANLREPGMSGKELFDRYCMFGDAPFVQGHDFSAWDYARDRARRLSA